VTYQYTSRAIFEHSIVALFIGRFDGTILDANQAACDLFGYTLEETRAHGLAEIIDPESSGLNRMLGVLEEKGDVAGELIGIHKSGKRMCCEFSSVRFENENGERLFSIQMIDITARRESQDRLRNIVEYSTNMFYSHDPGGNLTYVSPQSIDFLGYEFNGVEPMWIDYLTDHPGNRVGEEYTRKALETGQRQPAYELQLRKADGTLIWVEVNEAPVIQDGQVVQIIGSLTDITDRKRAEQEADQNQMLLTELTDQARAAVWVRSDNGTYIFVNREYRKLFAMEESVVGKTLQELFDKTTAAQFRANDQRVLESGEAEFIEEQIHTEKGERYYRTNLFPLKGNHGYDRLIGGISIDVTEQKMTEELIRSSLQEKNILLAEIHHRVKNNLAVVSSLLELQAMNSENEELKSQLLKATLRIHSMANIHEQLYQSDNFLRYHFSDGLRKLVEEVVSTFQDTTVFDVSFDLEIIELNINQAVPCSLLTNEVITNILKHSFHGRGRGRITVKLEAHGETVQLALRDDGNGLPDDFQMKEPDSMGLVLIRLLTKQLNGEASYDSDTSGTVFTLRFDKSDKKGSSSHFV